jgi:hypothetical protein
MDRDEKPLIQRADIFLIVATLLLILVQTIK